MGFLLRVRPLEAHSPSAYILTPGPKPSDDKRPCDVRLWHLADIDADAEHVRF